MGRRAFTIPLLIALTVAAAGSLAYAVRTGMADSADLERRAEEAALYRRGSDPYADPDNTYPPSALPVFAATVPGGPVAARRALWVALNLAALAGLVVTVLKRWGGAWPPWAGAAFGLAVAASKPVRAGIALGQFHLIPTTLIVAAEAMAGRAVISGLCVGLALIKPTMAAPYLLVMAVRRRWVALGVAGLVQAGLWGLAAIHLGIGPIALGRAWLRNARSQITMGTIDLPTLAGRVVPPSRLDPSLVSLAVLAGSGVLFVLLRKKKETGPGLLALALVSAAVLTYHRHYDMVLLLPALAYFLDAWSRGRGRLAGWAALGFGLVLVTPTNPGVTGAYEPLFDAGFVVASYAMAVLLVTMVAAEADE